MQTSDVLVIGVVILFLIILGCTTTMKPQPSVDSNIIPTTYSIEYEIVRSPNPDFDLLEISHTGEWNYTKGITTEEGTQTIRGILTSSQKTELESILASDYFSSYNWYYCGPAHAQDKPQDGPCTTVSVETNKQPKEFQKNREKDLALVNFLGKLLTEIKNS